MMLIVDKSELSSAPGVVAMLKKNFSKVIVKNLKHREYGGRKVTAGDINIPLDTGDVLAIERKTPEDFLNSIPDRHIFNQVETMATFAKYSCIIVTGAFTYGPNDDMCYLVSAEKGKPIKTNWTGKSVRAAITAIQYSGCPIIFCPPSFFPQAIAEQYSIVNKPDERQGIVKRRIITFPPIDERVEFIAQLPGVGLKLAESLLSFAGKMNGKTDDDLDYYGSVADALHWLSIMSHVGKSERPAGWGPGKILAARKFLGLDSNQYVALPKEVDLGNGSIMTEMNGELYDKVPF